MKPNLYLLVFMALCGMVSSCLKGSPDTPTKPVYNVTGNWALVRDSTTITFWGIWSGQPSTGTNYLAKPGDHYDFLADGEVYTKEDTTIDTAKYTLTKNTALTLNYTYLNNMEVADMDTVYSHISNFTISKQDDHNLVITGPTYVTPETTFTHILIFTR